MSDASKDPKQLITEAMQEVRAAMGQLRESVVMLVMRRNRLNDETKRQDRIIADLKEKIRLAEEQNRDQLASELKNELTTREAEMGRVRQQLVEAEVEAESAKARLPEEEARLAQQLSDLQAKLVRLSSTRIVDNALGTGGSDAFSRAEEKVRTLQSEALARQEIANTSKPIISLPSPEESAQKQLEALEERLGIAPPEVQEPPKEAENAPPTPAAFLEIDAPEEEPEATPAPEPEAVLEALEDASERAVEVVEPEPILLREEVETVEEAYEPEVEATEISEPEAEAEAEPTEGIEAQEELVPISEPTIAIEEEVALAEAELEPIPQSEVDEESETEVEAEPVPSFHVLTQTEKEDAPMNPDRRIRVAGVGTGAIFRGAHLPAYPEIAGAQMVAFCDPDPKALKLATERFASLTAAQIEKAKENKDSETIDRLNRDLDELKCYEDIQQIIDEVKPDLVDICTQPVLHTPLAIQALDGGLNVMCEKPVSRSWLETIPLKEAIARSGKFYQHNENWLFDKDYYTVKKLIDAGAIGEPILMFLATAHGGPEGNPKFWNSDFGGGGALLDNGIHAIGAAWYMSGLEKRPTLVKAAEPFGMTTRMPNRILGGRMQRVNVDDDAHILIRFEDPESAAWSTAHVEGSWSHRDSPDTCVIGTTGKIVFEHSEGRTYAVVYDAYENVARRIETSGPTWQPWLSSFYGEILNMVECVRAGVPSIMTADFGAECSAVVGAAYLSQKSGKRGITVAEYKQFALDIAAKYPNDAKAAYNALIDAQLAAVRG